MMRPELRNDKYHQEERLEAHEEAAETLQYMHDLLARHTSNGLNVGKAVNLAADVNLHRYRVAAQR